MQSVVHSVALLGIVFCVSSAAWAQSDEQRANARALADQGVQAFQGERWQEAVDLFERAESLVDAPTHLLFGARAHAKLHHYVKARELYLRISREPLRADAPRAFRNAQTSANQELSDVEPHIGQLTISIRGVDPKLAKVTMDGTVVQSVLIGVSRPIDPGEHQIQAEAPGFGTQSKQVTVGDGAKVSVVLELVPGGAAAVPLPLGATPPTATAVPGGSALSPTSAPSSPTPQTDVGPSASKSKRIGAYVAFGAGAVGIGLGAIFLSSSASKRSQADKAFQDCGGATGCSNGNPDSARVTALDNSARSAETMSIVGFAAGGLAVGAGALLFVLSRDHEHPSSGLSIEPQVGLGSLAIVGKLQ
jgi:PEGA domain